MPAKLPEHERPAASKSPRTSAAPSASSPTTHLLQRAQAGPDHITPQEALQLQRTIGNRAAAQLLQQQTHSTSEAPIQRTVDTAAAAIFENKSQSVRLNFDDKLTAKFLTSHDLIVDTPALLVQEQANVRAAVRILRINAAATKLRAMAKNKFPTNEFKPNKFGLVVGDLADVTAKYNALAAAAETPAQRAVRVFLAETFPDEKTTVGVTNATIEVYLDGEQAKHQPPGYPIGDRGVSGGQLFATKFATPAWHVANTIPHMVQWATALNGMQEGQSIPHGQMQNINGIHYEGFCFLANGKKYVLFHCYPHPQGQYDAGYKK